MSSATAPAPLARWHVGRWTMPAARPGEEGIVGRVLTYHEMLLDVTHIVRRLEWNQAEPTESQSDIWALMRVEVEYLPEGFALGTRSVSDHETELIEALEAVAHRAVRWLNDRAPAGYLFQLDGGLRLEPIADLSGSPVAPEAILIAAKSRGVEIPCEIGNLAVAHVVGPLHGDEWRAIHTSAFVAAGPFSSEQEAIEAVRAGRVALCDRLRESGADDLADTFNQWTEIPVDR